MENVVVFGVIVAVYAAHAAFEKRVISKVHSHAVSGHRLAFVVAVGTSHPVVESLRDFAVHVVLSSGFSH